jgi:hypothetical protein
MLMPYKRVKRKADSQQTLWESQNLLKERAKRADINACRAVLANIINHIKTKRLTGLILG